MKIALMTAKPNPDGLVGNHRFATDERRSPTGLGILYSVLREKGINGELYDRYCGETYWDKDDFADYDFVGLYCTSVCSEDIYSVLSRLKSRIIAVGGPHAYLYPESFPSNVRVVRGEAEHIIYDLVRGKISDKIITTPRLNNEELDNLPRYPYELFFNKSNYVWDFPFDKNISPVIVMNSSRGCPFNCSFCSVKKIWQRKYTYYSPEKVLDDALYIKSLGAQGIYFREDNFTCNNKRTIDICRLFIDNNVNLKWACETRVDTVDEHTLNLMYKAGCIGLYVGVENCSQHMLDVYNKGITTEQIIDFFKWTNSIGIKTAASFIGGHPEETMADRLINNKVIGIIKPTMKWVNQYRADG